MGQSDVSCRDAVLSCEERDSGRMTLGGVVELREAQSIGGECIKVGGFDFATVASEIRIPEIVDHDDHEVGAGGIRVLVGIRGCSDVAEEGQGQQEAE